MFCTKLFPYNPALTPGPVWGYHRATNQKRLKSCPTRSLPNSRKAPRCSNFSWLRQVERRTDKSGKSFLSLVLGDKSGTMVARVWSDVCARCTGPFAPGDYVGVQGQVGSYKGELQLNGPVYLYRGRPRRPGARS